MARKKKHTRSSVTPAGDAQIETLSRADAVDRYSSARKRKSRFKKLRVVLIVILVLILGVGGAAFAYIADINARVSDVDSSIRSSHSRRLKMVSRSTCSFLVLIKARIV